jgi:hypothetical protein
MGAFKAVQQHYTPGPKILWMLEQFRQMVNDCIGIGLGSNLTNMNAFSLKAYHELNRYDLPTLKHFFAR